MTFLQLHLHHICDVFVIFPNHPSILITVSTEESKSLTQYNVAVARELCTTMNRFIDDSYASLFGTMTNSDLQNVDSFKERIQSIIKLSSRFVTRSSLSMAEAKYLKVLNSFWMCLAKVQSGIFDHGQKAPIHFLTKEQCAILVEHNFTRKVNVKAKSKSGATVLMLEVAKRLHRTGPACIQFQLKCDTENYRHLHSESEVLPTTKHLVTDRYIPEAMLYSVQGSIWTFTSEFIPIHLFAKELQDVLEQRFLMVVGSPGEGKTVLLQMMLEHFHDKGTTVLPLEELGKLNEDEATVVFADDIFGKHSYTFHLTDEIEKFLETLRKNDHIKFRDDLHNQALPQLGRYKGMFQGQNRTDLSEIKDIDERRIMLKKYIHEEEKSLSGAIITKVVESTNSHGFPLSCHLYATTQRSNSDTDVVKFFENPIEHIKTLLRKHLDDPAMKVLLYILVSSNGTFDVAELSHQDSKEIKRFEEVKKVLGIQETCFLSRLHDAVAVLKVGLLKNTERGLTFHHPSIYEAAASVIAEKDIDFIVRHASLVFFTHTHKMCMVTLPQQRFNAVSKRLSRKLENGDIPSYKSILLQDEMFVDEVCGHLLPFLANNHQRRADMMYWAASSKPSSLLRKLISRYFEDDISVQSAIRGCCRWGDNSSLHFIFEKDKRRVTYINLISENGLPCLIIAANQNHNLVVGELLAFGVDVNVTESRTGGTALHLAAATGHTPVVSMLLKQGIFIDQENIGGATALFLSSSNGHAEVVKQLLENGANVNRQIESRMMSLEKRPSEGSAEIRNMHYSDKGFAPLHAAAFGGHDATVKILLNHKANPCIVSRQGSAVEIAAKANKADIFMLLITDPRVEREAALSAAYEYGRMTMLGELIAYSGSKLIKESFDGNEEIIHKILQNDPDCLKSSIEGFTALHFASVAGREKVVELLLEKGSDVHASLGKKLTALHGAVINGHSSIAEQLLQHKGEVNAYCESEYNALHFASMHGHAEVVHVLLKHGTDVNAQGFRKWTPLHLACNENHLDVVVLLLQHGAKKELLADNLGTPLLFAAYEGNLEVADLMLENKAVLNPEGEVFPPLLGAAIATNRKSIKHLLKNRAFVNHVSSMGIAAIHGATLMGSLEVVMELVSAEADVNLKLFEAVKDEDKEKVFNHILTWGKTTPGRHMTVLRHCILRQI